MKSTSSINKSGMFRIACYSDPHGVLAKPVDCDLAIIAGDVCPEFDRNVMRQFAWLNGPYFDWLSNFKKVVWIGGNHDYICSTDLIKSSRCYNTYLQDSVTVVDGLRIWGSPWSLPYGTYPFMAPEEYINRQLQGVNGAYIIISHGPPFGYGDMGDDGHPAGSKALLAAIRRHKPVAVVYGHIHDGRGVYYEGDTLLVNAAMAGENPGRGLEYPPILVDFDSDGRVANLTI